MDELHLTTVTWTVGDRTAAYHSKSARKYSVSTGVLIFPELGRITFPSISSPPFLFSPFPLFSFRSKVQLEGFFGAV